jgi:hypothetical protein
LHRIGQLHGAMMGQLGYELDEPMLEKAPNALE